MVRHEVRQLTIRRYPAPVRRWMRWSNRHGVWSEASSQPWWWQWFGVLVPYRLRDAHRWYARSRGLFWQPCPLCGAEFGGHEWRNVRGLRSSVPDPCGPRNMSVGICPRCTAAGRGVDVDLEMPA